MNVSLITGFRLYRDAPYLVFVQEFPEGFKSYASGDWTVPSVVFPHFMAESARSDLYSWLSVGYGQLALAYGSAFTQDKTVDLLLVADRDFDTTILSPFSDYLVATQQSSELQIKCGIEGLVEQIPPGFKHEHIMSW